MKRQYLKIFSEFKRWFIVVKGIVANPAYIGHSRHGQKVNKAAHEPLVSQRLYDTANAVVGVKRTNDGRLSSQALLNGIVRCDWCGYALGLTGNAGTVTVAGTVTLALSSDRDTLNPPVAAARLRPTVHTALPGPVTLAGVQERLVRLGVATG